MPSSVVRSIMATAILRPASLAEVLMLRLAKVAARSSAIAWSMGVRRVACCVLRESEVAHGTAERFQVFVGCWLVCGLRIFVLRELHELGNVIRSSCFEAGAEGAFAHAPERLAQHDCACGSAVDVEIARAHTRLPLGVLAFVETV